MPKYVKLLILRGLPGAGKSTFANGLVEDGFKRCSKDDLRSSFDNGIFSPQNEALLNEITYDVSGIFLEAGYDIVWDNCNLNPYHFKRARDIANCINDLSRVVHVTIQLKDFNIDTEECIRRDALRPKPVTEAVIRKMAAQWTVDGKFLDMSKYVDEVLI